MKFDEHCAESVKLFGRSFEEVHIWLDQFAGTEQYGMRHRRVRHHTAGLIEVGKLFGAEAIPVARQHIVSDLKTEGWTENDPFPKNERDFVRIGFF